MNQKTPYLVAVVVFSVIVPFVSAGPIEDENLYAVPRAELIVDEPLIDRFKQATRRTDAETRLEALEAIVDHQLHDLSDDVLRLLDDERVLVRVSAVRAAHALNLKQSADKLVAFIRENPPNTPSQRALVNICDLALAQWGDATLTDHWIERLADAAASTSLRASAATALGKVHLENPPSRVVEALSEAAGRTANPPAVRLAAADAMVARSQHQSLAVQLMSGDLVDRLCGIRMLPETPDASAVAALQQNATHSDPAVQAAALAVLYRTGAEALPFDLITQVIASKDPLVRRWAVQGTRLHPTSRSVTFTFAQLNDAHPDVRDMGTQSLVALAENPARDVEIRAHLVSQARHIADFDDAGKHRHWGTAQQLCRLALALEHQPVATTLVDLLDYPRVEVAIAAVQAIRVLDVAQTRPAIVKLMQDLIVESATFSDQLSGLDDKKTIDEAVAIIQGRVDLADAAALTLGVWAEPAADPILRPIVRKDHPITSQVRVSGIWALGRINEGKPDNALAQQLAGRLRDTEGLNPESDEVREQSAVTIGRMHARSQLNMLNRHYAMDGESAAIRSACRWGIGQITGEMPEAIQLKPYVIRDTFLTPLRSRE